MKSVKIQFPLENDPIDFQLSVHFGNLIATYGEEVVKEFFKEIYQVSVKPKKQKKVSNS